MSQNKFINVMISSRNSVVFDGKEFELKTYLRNQGEESRDSIIKIID